MPGHEKAHLLDAEAVRVSKSLGAATGLTDLGFHLMTVSPGRAYSEYRRHLYEEQCFFVLSGRGEATIDEKTYPIEPGDFLGFRKQGAAHTIVNSGEVPLVMLSARTSRTRLVCTPGPTRRARTCSLR